MNYWALIFALVAICWWRSPTGADQSPMTVALKNAEGKQVGTATLEGLAQGVRIRLDVNGLPPGEHAFHFHETGKCEAPKFESAGGHFAPKKNPHGFNSKGGPHAGDMPNIHVPESGSARIEVVNPNVTLNKGANSLLKKDGTSLVIHASADDYRSQPSGNAGDRLACGEIKAAL